MPRDEGAGVTEVLGLEGGFSAQDRRRTGREGRGRRRRRAGWGEQGQEWRGLGHPVHLRRCLSSGHSLTGQRGPVISVRSVSVPPRSRTGARGGAGGACGGGC